MCIVRLGTPVAYWWWERVVSAALQLSGRMILLYKVAGFLIFILYYRRIISWECWGIYSHWPLSSFEGVIRQYGAPSGSCQVPAAPVEPLWGPQGYWAPYGYAGGLHEVLLLSLSLGQSGCVQALHAEGLGV